MAELSEYKYYREQLQCLYPSLSTGLIEELSLDWQVRHFPARSHLIHAGEKQAQAFFIVEGLVRAYYPDVEADITVNFIIEGEMRSAYSFQALEPVVAVTTSYAYLRELCLRRNDAEGLLRRLIEVEYARAFAHLQTFLTRSAEERYRLFLKEFGDILPRISVTDLSSYLGVSRQNLTMIRKRLLSE